VPSTQHLGHTLTWQEHSAGEATYIFIHGYSAARQSWDAILPTFQPLGRCVTLDLPGHGQASVPPDYTVLTQDLLLDLECAAIQDIAQGHPVTIIGHSTGGLVALGAAARLPRLVKRVVAVDAVIWGPLSGILGLTHKLLRRRLYPLYWCMMRLTQLGAPALIWGLRQYVYDPQALWADPEVWDAIRKFMPIYRRMSIRNLAILLNMLEVCDLRPVINGLTTPALIFSGAQDPVVPCEQARWASAHMPAASLHVMPHCGHTPFMEHRPDFERIVLDWLKTWR